MTDQWRIRELEEENAVLRRKLSGQMRINDIVRKQRDEAQDLAEARLALLTAKNGEKEDATQGN